MKKEEKAPEVQALRGPMPTAKWINLIEGFPPFPWPTLTKPDLHSRRFPAQAQYQQAQFPVRSFYTNRL